MPNFSFQSALCLSWQTQRSGFFPVAYTPTKLNRSPEMGGQNSGFAAFMPRGHVVSFVL
jgi:hypothetical protein